MSKKKIVIDEVKYPMAWRFNDKDCALSDDDKKGLVLLDEKDSENLWKSFFPFEHFMKMNRSFCSVIDKVKLDFDNPQKSAAFFQERLRNISHILFFLGQKCRGNCAIKVTC